MPRKPRSQELKPVRQWQCRVTECRKTGEDKTYLMVEILSGVKVGTLTPKKEEDDTEQLAE